MARILEKLDPPESPVQSKRKLLAEFCKMVGDEVGRPAPRGEGLSPRLQQTLERILAGDSEKQIALHLGLSPHTVHIYVKNLYRHYGVSSRGELFAQFVRPGSQVKKTGGQSTSE
jgi:DNA-binding CsgD family transcriptional regulator